MASRFARRRAAVAVGPTLRARPAACTLADLVQDPPSDSDAARRVRDTWNGLAATPWRDFFVASHAGWRDPHLFDAQAAADLSHFLTGLGRRWLARRHVLEIGCGVGRLARPLAALAHSYTGFDIADAMVQEARRRCAGRGNVRLLTGDGTRVPAIARDRRYGLVLAAAVFIHCPRELIESTVRSAAALLDRDGTFRLQLRVDAD